MWASGGLSAVLREDHSIGSAGSNAAPKMRHLPVSPTGHPGSLVRLFNPSRPPSGHVSTD